MYLSIPVFQGASELRVRRTDACKAFLHRFPTFSAVRTLVLEQEAVGDFVQHPAFASYVGRFPALEVIRFTGFDCAGHIEPRLPPLLPGESRAPVKWSGFYEAIIDTLDECFEAGLCKEWQRIELVRCRKAGEVVERIKSEVRLKGLCESVVVVCEDEEGYEGNGESDWSDG